MIGKLKLLANKYRNLLVLILVVGLVTFVCLHYFVPRYEIITNTDRETNSDKIFKAFNKQGSIVCIVNNNKLKGRVFIDGQKVKLEEDAGGKYGNVLLLDDTVYIWKNKEKSGKEISLKKYPIAKSFINKSEISKLIDDNSSHSSCEESLIDENIFRLPRNILFTEVNLQDFIK